MKIKSTRSLIGCAAALAFAGNAQAATITSVGTELGQGASYIVENWSNAAVAKTYDLNNTEKYGTAGYYQIRPTTGD